MPLLASNKAMKEVVNSGQVVEVEATSHTILNPAEGLT